MSYLPMLAMIAAARRHRRRAMMDNLWPAMIPTTNVMQRSTIAAVAADNTVRRAERAEARAARETASAIRLAAAQPGGKLTDAQLQSLPALSRINRFAPDVRRLIDGVVADQNATLAAALDTVTEEAGKLASALVNLSGTPPTITKDQLVKVAPNLVPLLESAKYIESDVFKPDGSAFPTVATPTGGTRRGGP